MAWKPDIGALVRFGRPLGEKRVGEVVQINRTTVTIRCDKKRYRCAREFVWSATVNRLPILPKGAVYQEKKVPTFTTTEGKVEKVVVGPKGRAFRRPLTSAERIEMVAYQKRRASLSTSTEAAAQPVAVKPSERVGPVAISLADVDLGL